MKVLRFVGFVALFGLGVGFGALYFQIKDATEGTVAGKAGPDTALEHAVKHLDPSYVCPMHPQIVRDQPGSCPICGMELVAVEQDAGAAERRVLYYRHPHNPTITSDRPMKDEMGMDYVAVYDDDGDAVSVRIAPEVVNNMGVRTAPAERGRLWRLIDTVGYVDYDKSRLAHVHLRTDGWIDKLYVESEGERVKKGQRLLDLYSPTLVNAQEEYLQARLSGNQKLIDASYDRLAALGISEGQVEQLKKSGRALQTVSFFAPQDGVVALLNTPEGMYVKPATELMTLADLSSVWLLAEVFEHQVDWVRLGQSADVRLSYMPGRLWEGRVEYVYPSLDPKTRTLKVRLRFDNPDELLKPNMYANVSIYGGPKDGIVYVPREALIRSGQEERVVLDAGDGRFQPRTVISGMESGDWVEIVDGLKEGERVVVSGQFLIDSEASLKASIMRMGAGAPPTADHAALPGPVQGRGILKAVKPGGRTVSLYHEPIPALGWPDMTMDFRLGENADLADLVPGDAVEFELVEGPDGYLIDSVRKVDR